MIEKSDTANITEAVRLFEKALASPNIYIRQSAAGELVNLMIQGTELSARTMQQVRRHVSGFWAAAFEAVDNPAREKALEFFLSYKQMPSNEARVYVLQEYEKQNVTISESELAAINGHYAISRLQYNEALAFFRTFQNDDGWAATIPALFLEYPDLISDLGRAFQYTAFGAEGLALFLQWGNNLTDDIADDIRYRLMFFAARISRRIGQSAQAVSLFEQALLLAPKGEQSDACIWYILDISLNNRSVFIQHLERLTPYLQSGSYINDILERYLQILVSAMDWKNIIRIFNLVQNSNVVIKAGYAWVIARTIEEGFLSAEEMKMAADAVNIENADASVFMQIAYNAVDNVSSALYYRLLSATALEIPFLEFSETPEQESPSQALQFLLGFFTHDIAEHAHSFITQLEQELSPCELRIVALSLEQAGMYAQSMRLVSRYINREGYFINRGDMELLFPRAYNELVEKYALENNIAPEILFGLIRTESAFQTNVVSRAGAVGLTQLMPDTAEEMVGRIRRSGGPDYAALENGYDLYDPEQNIHIGAFYLNYLMGRFEDKLLSVMAYNGGMTRIRRWRAASSLPVDLFLETIVFFETRDYGRKVLADAEVYKALYY